jgi:hypothetical protein
MDRIGDANNGGKLGRQARVLSLDGSQRKPRSESSR